VIWHIPHPVHRCFFIGGIPVFTQEDFSPLFECRNRIVSLQELMLASSFSVALLREQRDTLFLLVGNELAKAQLEKKAEELKLDNLCFMPFQPHASLPWLRPSSDVQVSLYKSGAANESFSSKLMRAWRAAGRFWPAAESDSEVERAVNSAGCGLCIEHFGALYSFCG
jgi:hypothetical protein